MRYFIAFVIAITLLSTINNVSSQGNYNWYEEGEDSLSSRGGNPLKDSVGNVIFIDTDDFAGSYKCLDYKNGWVLIEEDDGDQRWINSNQIIYFYGQGKIGEVPTQDLPFAALSILGIVVAALITYRRQH